MPIKIVIMDVDGTLTPYRLGSTAPFARVLLPGVVERCADLRAAGVVLALCSNQGGARRNRPAGRLSIGAVHAHLRWVQRTVGATKYWFATTGARKKPAPTMLQEIAEYFGVTPADMLSVGDAESDAEAAQAFGCDFVYAKDFF